MHEHYIWYRLAPGHSLIFQIYMGALFYEYNLISIVGIVIQIISLRVHATCIYWKVQTQVWPLLSQVQIWRERERESHRCYLQPSIDSSGDPWSKLNAVYNNGITGVGSFNN